MELSVDILSLIFLHLEPPDILSCFLTCKYLYRVTERYNFWLELHRKYMGEINPAVVDQNNRERNWPDLPTLRDTFRMNFHWVSIRAGNPAYLHVDKFKKAEDKILCIFISIYGMTVIEKNGDETLGIPNQEYIIKDGLSLKEHRDNYAVIDQVDQDRVSMALKSEIQNGQRYLEIKQCNMYHLFKDFIILLEQYFTFEYIQFEYGFEMTATLINARVNNNRLNLDCVTSDGEIILDVVYEYNVGEKLYTLSIFIPEQQEFIEVDIDVSKYKSIITRTI